MQYSSDNIQSPQRRGDLAAQLRFSTNALSVRVVELELDFFRKHGKTQVRIATQIVSLVFSVEYETLGLR